MNERIFQAAKNALADLEGIMPEFEPSGDRNHPAWRTINELKTEIAQVESNITEAQLRNWLGDDQHNSDRLVDILFQIATRQWSAEQLRSDIISYNLDDEDLEDDD